MNDIDLIDELRDGMRSRTADTEIPEGFATQARRTARRRSARRAATAGTPLLAAAGVATVLATSGSSTGSRAHSQTPSMGSGQTHDTAYILKRVKANVAAATQSGTVIHTDTYRSGEVNADGSLANLGWKMDDRYQYIATDGTEYSRDTLYYQNGTPELTTIDAWAPDTGNDGTLNETVIDPANNEYNQSQYARVYNPDVNPSAESMPTVYSTPSQVQQALQSGQVTQAGTTTVDGTQAIVLTIEMPNAPGNPNTDVALYVDAQTYQPLRAVQRTGGQGNDLIVENWMPATADNVKQAKNGSVPTGDTNASLQQVDAGTHGK